MYTTAQLTKDISILMSHGPYLEPLLYMAPMRVDATVPTAYCSRTELVFGAQFMGGLTPAQRLGVIIHECQHGLLCHMSSDFTDSDISTENFARLRNIAMDYVVEREVLEISAASGGVVQSARPAKYIKEVHEFGQMSYIEIYKLLKSKKLPIDEGWADIHIVDSQGLSDRKELSEAVAAAMQAIKDNCEAGMTRGDGSAVLGVGHAAEVDWRAQLRSLLHEVKSDDGRTWRSVNLRALLCFGRWEPARHQIEPRLRTVRILLDTSGSMSDGISDAVQDIAQVLVQVACENAEIRYYGSGLLDRVDKVVEDGQVVIDVALMRDVPNGGGTSVIEALNELAAETWNDNFEGVTICVTDGQDNLDVSHCHIRPDFWIIYGSAAPPNAPFMRINP